MLRKMDKLNELDIHVCQNINIDPNIKYFGFVRLHVLCVSHTNDDFILSLESAQALEELYMSRSEKLVVTTFHLLKKLRCLEISCVKTFVMIFWEHRRICHCWRNYG